MTLTHSNPTAPASGPTSGAPWLLSDPDPDAGLVERLRAGDERAFSELVSIHSPAMLRVARRYARSSAVAEEAVQETWVAVLEGLDRFEGRSSVKTWIFRILVNQVQRRAAREARVLPMTDLLTHGAELRGQAEERLMSSSRERWPGHWSSRTADWAARPDHAALTAELITRVHEAIAVLPAKQRQVLTLRDVDGVSAEEVCRTIGLRPVHQRVLLHRARAAVRADVSAYLADSG